MTTTVPARAEVVARPGTAQMTVSDIADAAGVRTLTLVRPDGALLPPYVPGSHIVLECGERSNAYSLLDDGSPSTSYRISVLLCPGGSGGSRWVHEELVPGAPVRLSPPRSAFAPVASARHHLMIAAGIGITPLVSHAAAARTWGRSHTVLYRYRPGRGSLLEELRAGCGDALEEFTDGPAFSARLSIALTTQPLGSHLYVCGPAGFTDLVLAAALDAGWPAGRLHTERFSASVLDPGRPFSVRLGDGRVLEIPPGVSLLEALESGGVPVPSRCRQGVCGECRVGVLGGRPEHRDLYLSEAERAANDSLMCCVSRGHDDLELSL